MRAIIRHSVTKIFLLVCITAGSMLCATEGTESNIEDFGEEVQDWQVRLELARVLSYQKRYEESIKEYRKILAVSPTHQVVKLELAQVLAYAGKKEEALSLLDQISLGQLDEKSRLGVADIFASTGRFDEATRIYVAYLTKQPEDLKARLKYAQLLSWAKKYEESIEEFRELVKKRPEDIQLRRKYALVLIWAGETDQARELLEPTLPVKSHETR